MKKMILFICILFTIHSNAATLNTSTVIDHPQHKDTPVSFMVNEVIFNVFADGTFDFQIPEYHSHARIYSDIPQAPTRVRSRRYYDPFHITTNHHGDIISIGNIYIKYDKHYRVRKIGNIDIRYHKHRLSQIGGLFIHYHRNGAIKYVDGNVYYLNCGYCGSYNCTAVHEVYYPKPYPKKHRRKHKHKKHHHKHKKHKHKHKHHHKKHKHHKH